MFVAVGEVTCCVGDFIAMIVADTQFHARQAAKKINVDYEVLEPITDPFKALEPDAPRIHSDDTLRPAPNVIDFPTKFGRGDVDAAFATAAHVIEATYQTQAVDIAFLEPESCLAYPQGNGIKVHSESQGSQFDQKAVAKALNLSESDVEIALAASGGSFGAKEELSIQAQTAMAAYLLGRPVKTTLTREQSTQHHVKRHPMTITLKIGADAEGHLLAVKSRIVGDAGGYAGTSGKCLLRAGCHSCGPYRVPNVDVEAKAVYTNNPTSGAMRGFGTNQAHFAIEGVMDILAGKIGVDGWEIRSRNILNPGDQFATGQVMRESVRGLRESLDAVKNIYRNEKYAGVSCGIKSTGIGNGTTEEGRVIIRVLPPSPEASDFAHGASSDKSAGQAEATIEILNGYTEMGQGLYTATMQAVCEETGLPDTIMDVHWDKELGAICGETWASRATTLSCAAAQKAAHKLADDLKTHALGELAGREYMGSVVYSFTTKPGTPEAKKDPTTHFTFSYATQVVILDEEGHLKRVVAAHDVGRAINPRLCAEQMEGGVHMGLGYALSENFTSTNGRPDSLKMRDFGLVPAKHMPEVDIILIEVPDEYGGYGAKGVGEIGCVATASAVASALHAYDGKRRFKLPMDDAKAAAPMLPKSRRT
jgi:xanthine dehydrogenase molybdenum-binding subunit